MGYRLYKRPSTIVVFNIRIRLVADIENVVACLMSATDIITEAIGLKRASTIKNVLAFFMNKTNLSIK